MKSPNLTTVQKTVIRHACPSRTSLPIINSLQVHETWRSIYGNNLDYTYRVSDTGNYSDEHTYMLDKKTALAHAGEAIGNGGDTLTIGAVSIPYDKSRMDEYPVAPDTGKPLTRVYLSWPYFRDVCRWFASAASSDLTRLSLCSIFLECTPAETFFVASDGHRLYRDTIPGGAGEAEVLLPRDLALGIGKLPTYDSGCVTIEVPELDKYGSITIELGNVLVEYCFRPVEGPFPAYRQVWPKQVDHETLLNVSRLTEAVKRCLEVAPKKTRTVQFECKDSVLTISARNPETNARVEVPIQATYGTPDFLIGFNGAYVLDILAGTDSSAVTLGWTRPDSATVWTISESRAAILMPLRLSD